LALPLAKKALLLAHHLALKVPLLETGTMYCWTWRQVELLQAAQLALEWEPE
jgi:hypothetical protein